MATGTLLDMTEKRNSDKQRALDSALALLWDLRFSLVTIVLAGFGRAASEVGAVMIVGGNIDGVTREPIYGRMTHALDMEVYEGPFRDGMRHG